MTTIVLFIVNFAAIKNVLNLYKYTNMKRSIVFDDWINNLCFFILIFIYPRVTQKIISCKRLSTHFFFLFSFKFKSYSEHESRHNKFRLNPLLGRRQVSGGRIAKMFTDTDAIDILC